MEEESIRVLHTGDWRLDQPCRGITHYPSALAARLASATQESVGRIIEFAIGEKVHAVVVGGNILDPLLAAPADYGYLLSQLERLQSAAIPVIWNWSWLDRRQHWPRCFVWPDNVTQFIGESPQVITQPINNDSQLTFIGLEVTSQQEFDFNWFEGLKFDGPAFGVGYGQHNGFTVDCAIQHWLLSGEPYGTDCPEGGIQVYYSGSPQGRDLKDTGPHGASLIELKTDGNVECQFINTSTHEYQRLSLNGSAVSSKSELLDLIIDAVRLRSFDSSIIYTITVHLTATGSFLRAFQFLDEYPELMTSVQTLFTEFAPNLIFAGISTESAETSNISAEQEVLGEYLFVINELRDKGWTDLRLQSLLLPSNDNAWSHLHEDLTGLDTLRMAEHLGIHLFNGTNEDAA